MYFNEGKLFVNTVDCEFYIINNEGKLIEKKSDICSTFFMLDEILYQDRSNDYARNFL